MPTPGPKGAVKKEQQVNEKTLTRARTAKHPLAKPSGIPPGLMDGVSFTRSKSQRDRLGQLSAQLAQGVEAAAVEKATGGGDGRGVSIAAMPPPPWRSEGLPLARSAYSELALTLDDMST